MPVNLTEIETVTNMGRDTKRVPKTLEKEYVNLVRNVKDLTHAKQIILDLITDLRRYRSKGGMDEYLRPLFEELKDEKTKHTKIQKTL